MNLTLEDPIKRVGTLDFLRGIAIFIVIINHFVAYYVYSNDISNIGEMPTYLIILLSPFVLFGTWASLFAIITGAATTFSIYSQIATKKTNFNQRIKNSTIRGIILLVINLIYMFLFCHPIKGAVPMDYQSGLIGASIREGRLMIPTPSILFYSSALTMLAFSDLFLVIALKYLFRNEGYKKLTRNYICLGVIGGFFVLFTPLVAPILTPLIGELYSSGKYFQAMLMVYLVGTRHAIFPFVGFAFFSSILGIAIAQPKVTQTQIRKTGIPISIVFFGFGLLDIILNGFPDYFTPVQPMAIYTINLGLQLMLLTWLLTYLEFIPMKDRKPYNRYEKTIFLRRFGLVSLTVFVFEYVITSIYARFVEFVWPGSIHDIYIAFFFWLLIYMVLWGYALRGWARKYYKYSIEWWIAYLLRSPKPDKNSDILNSHDILYRQD